jgi:hypothetical protein
MATANATYAAQRNARYSNTSSNLVDLVNRYNDTVNALPLQARRNHQSALAKALKQFKANHPGLKNFADRTKFRMCKSINRRLADIQIDTTMQREPDLKWIIMIITNFRAYQAQPIQVYDAPNSTYGSWDGHHSALALYLISTQALGE